MRVKQVERSGCGKHCCAREMGGVVRRDSPMSGAGARTSKDENACGLEHDKKVAAALLTAESIDELQKCGSSRWAICLDGPDAATNDGFWRVEGTVKPPKAALRHVRAIGLETQVQTNVSKRNLNRLLEMAEQVGEAHAKNVESLLPGGK